MEKIVLVFVSLFVCQFSITVDAQIKYVGSRCRSSNLNYTDDSSYGKNLDFVFSKLTSASSSIKFDNYTTGDGSDKVYGLYQCRYDLSLRVCSDCVNEASRSIVKDCPSSGEAIVWYDECTLRYANRNIFSLSETLFTQYRQSSIKVSNYTEFAPILENTMNGLIKNASTAFPHFAAGKTNLTSEFDKLYSFAQCTADLDASGCNDCLKTALSKFLICCNANTAAWAFLPSCLLWYDRSPFLKDIPSPPPPPPPRVIRKGSESSKMKKLNRGIIAAIVTCVSVGLLFLFGVIGIRFCRKEPREARSDEGPRSPLRDGKGKQLTGTEGVQDKNEPELVIGDAEEVLGETEFEQYKFKTLQIATQDFSDENMLGKGGFGIVYKGAHKNGKELAIKRLSQGNSRQGTKEFMTEARLLAKLQHRNLVKLLGFCSERDEKLLVYEFMPNSSLDVFLFDPTKRPVLNWVTRSKIITGIARGLQYIHEDSRLTVIHRDLKPNNILLDMNMNPKIADFGLAKLYESDEKFGNTDRIAGTLGYMAPEYLMAGDYSDKTDVYSFGIMLLEIVSGRKNRIINNNTTQQEDFSIQAWRLWNKERSFEIIDPILLDDNCPNKEVLRYIQIGLLCVQANAEERPTMTAVVFMLTCAVDLLLPSAPMMTLNHNSDGQQSDVDRSSSKSMTMTADITDDSYSIPR